MNCRNLLVVLIWVLVFAGAYIGARFPGWYEARKIRAETARKWEVTLKSAHEATEYFDGATSGEQGTEIIVLPPENNGPWCREKE